MTTVGNWGVRECFCVFQGPYPIPSAEFFTSLRLLRTSDDNHHSHTGAVQRRCGIRQSGGRHALLRTVWHDADAHGAGCPLKRPRGSGSTLQPSSVVHLIFLNTLTLGPPSSPGREAVTNEAGDEEVARAGARRESLVRFVGLPLPHQPTRRKPLGDSSSDQSGS
jgi:hypothetical protein